MLSWVQENWRLRCWGSLGGGGEVRRVSVVEVICSKAAFVVVFCGGLNRKANASCK